jgi:hypothetical protein
MNRRVIWLTALICLAIIVACGLAALLFYRGVTVPILSTREAIQSRNNATQKAYEMAITQTQAVFPTKTPQPGFTWTPTARYLCKDFGL